MFRIVDLVLFMLAFFIAIVVASCEKRRQNIVLILSDDLRPAIFAYGDPIAKTPNIDRFISISSYFTRAYSQQALCAPSRNSMLTGRRPDTLHLYDFYNYWRTFAGNFTTIPQYFKDNGYHTYSIGKVFHPGVSSNFNDDYPASWSLPAFHPVTERYMNSAVCPDGSGTLKKNLICHVRVSSQPNATLPDIESIVEAKKFLLEQETSSQPFFLAVGFHKPHIPFRFPEKYLKLHPRSNFKASTSFRPYGLPSVAWNPFMDLRRRDDFKQLDVPFPYGPIPEEFATSIKQAYYSSVSYIDDLFGQLVAAIDLTNTIVVFTSDHGWSLGEHGEWAKYSNFEVASRVPLIVYSPDIAIKGSQVRNDLVELVDLFPTLVDLAKLPKIHQCKNPQHEILCSEGKSLVGTLQERISSEEDNIAFSQYPRPGAVPTDVPNSDEPHLSQIRVMGYSLRTHDFRYTLWIKFNPKNFTKDWNQIYGEELYDHRVDPTENMNLYDRPGFFKIRKTFKMLLKEKFKD